MLSTTRTDLYLRIVAPRNLFIEFIARPDSHWENAEKFLKGAWFKWRSSDSAEELIVVFIHNVINFYLLQIRALCMYTSFYDSFHLFA